MAEFIVRIEVPAVLPLEEAERSEIYRREAEEGRRLVNSGLIERMWRLPGERASLSLWRVDDIDELHAALMSMPIAEWATFAITTLASHYLEAD